MFCEFGFASKFYAFGYRYLAAFVRPTGDAFPLGFR